MKVLSKAQKTALMAMKDEKPSTMPGVRVSVRCALLRRGLIENASTGLIAKQWKITTEGKVAIFTI